MSTVTILSTAPPAATITDTPADVTVPPIVYFFWLVLRISSAAYAAVTVAFSSGWSLFKTILAPARSLLSTFSTPLFYIIAPVTVLARILLEVLVLTPYSLVTGFAREVYPIYVFVGVTCIWAVFVGLCARGVTHYMQISIFGEENLVSARDQTTRKSAEAFTPKTTKKVSIKEESDIEPIFR